MMPALTTRKNPPKQLLTKPKRITHHGNTIQT
jgi:hypothetical protein